MSARLQPSTIEELAGAVRSAAQVLPTGGGTKPGLSASGAAVSISTARLTGIVDYSPSEFTFTARAGTPVRDIIAALAEQKQYLPFDPPLAAAGATLGGTVAAGLDGPGRLRFGGIRDFILGIRFVDGEGRLLRMGGKVVKNAAGFDLPKFFVGSLGRFGILAEITFKVFPRPDSTLTLEFAVSDDSAMAGLLGAAAKGRWELEALDASFSAGKAYARVGGPPDALEALAADLGRRWPSQILSSSDAARLWQAANDFSWAHPNGVLSKIPLTLARLPQFAALTRNAPGARDWISAAGNVGYLSLPEGAEVRGIDEQLRNLGFEALVFRGGGPLWLGLHADFRIHEAVKHALDPLKRFPSLR
jgi:glycolate oxidase FAD binding subunit